MSIWSICVLSDLQLTFYHTVFPLLESSTWTICLLLPQSLQNGVGWSYCVRVAWYGKQLVGFLSVQVTNKTLQYIFYYGNSQIKQVLS